MCIRDRVASAQFGKRFLQSAGPEWGTRVGAGCFFLMGTLKIFEELRKRRRKKQGKPEARLEHLVMTDISIWSFDTMIMMT